MTFKELISVLRLMHYKLEWLWILNFGTGTPELITGGRSLAGFDAQSKTWRFNAADRCIKESDKVWPPLNRQSVMQLDMGTVNYINRMYGGDSDD